MRILIDECLPRKLKHEFVGHEVFTVSDMGWAGLKNGTLLREMRGKFDAFVTVDGNLTYQQNISSSQIAVIVLKSVNNKLVSLLPLMVEVRERLSTISPGDIVKSFVNDAKLFHRPITRVWRSRFAA